MKQIASVVLCLIISAVTFAQSSKATTGKLNGHEWVDLGLPSGTLWATCNVGANTPEGYGDYFAWGETKTKSTFSWTNYSLGISCDNCYQNTQIVKYNPDVDALKTLETIDDAATVNWGEGWRIPTIIEIGELISNCSHEFVKQNGVWGRLFTGPNGNSIFLPAAGKRLDNSLSGDGSWGTYWSSSLTFTDNKFWSDPNSGRLCEFTPYRAFSFYIEMYRCDLSYTVFRRQVGLTVRAVCSSKSMTNHSNAGQSNSPHDGEIKGVFSVSDTKKVMFSKGNLQYQGSTNTWRFAENQYTMIGCSGGNIAPSATQSGWIDLFGWGTSGYKNKYPYMVSKNDYDYRAKEDGRTHDSYCILNDIAGTQYDWGVHNAITNGGNKVNIWRTLSYAEWEYLISKRSNASNKKALANVNGVNGCVLLPDKWTLPSGCSFNPGVENGFSTNKYTVEQWKLMENAGAVFLPAAGCRLGTSTNVAGQYGFYWSTTDTEESAHYFSFTDGTNDNTKARIAVGKRQSYRYRGKAVRLVKDVE